MDEAVLDGARQYAFQDGKNTQGVVVVHHDAIVAEWYAPGRDASSYAASWSAAKSFTSALIGIAIGQGLIPNGLDAKMSDYIPSWQGTVKEAIRLRDVLSMASGLNWFETFDLTNSNVAQMALSNPDELAYAASIDVAHPPDTVFNYSSGDAMLVSAVLQKATGMRADQYAAQVLFKPLGLRQVDWWRDAADHTLTYCCIDTTSRSFARFGLLYLHQGVSGNDHIVPRDWVVASTSPNDVYEGYGYLWWLSGRVKPGLPVDTFSARGQDDQYIYVIPSRDLVVVRNGLYVKYNGPAVADPNLFQFYPCAGLVPGQGTVPADSWSDEEFLTPILNSIQP
jgi:CubicO group peptidase (beta-lactamase class C family)